MKRNAIGKETQQVVNYDTFTEDNNPYGPQDFGAFEFNWAKCVWKIDCYEWQCHIRAPPKPVRSRSAHSGESDVFPRSCPATRQAI